MIGGRTGFLGYHVSETARCKAMTAAEDLEIRESVEADQPAIESLYPKAFPAEDLVPLVRDLLDEPAVAVSLVATIDQEIAGHVILTRCGVSATDLKAALLGPLAVTPHFQRQGVGSALMRDGLQRMQDQDVDLVCLLGDPNYYQRFGFQPEKSVEPPHPLPAEWVGAWQSIWLCERNASLAGTLSVPRQWHDPALWAP